MIDLYWPLEAGAHFESCRGAPACPVETEVRRHGAGFLSSADGTVIAVCVT